MPILVPSVGEWLFAQRVSLSRAVYFRVLLLSHLALLDSRSQSNYVTTFGR